MPANPSKRESDPPGSEIRMGGDGFILIMNNGYLGPGMSGGARNMLDIAAEWAENHSISVVIPAVAERVVPEAVPRTTYPSRFPRGVVDTIWTYIVRIIRASWIAGRKRAGYVVCSSSLLHDVLPAWIHQRCHRSRMAVFVYHLVPKRTAPQLSKKLQFMAASMAQAICLRLYRSADVIFAGNQLVYDKLCEHGIPKERMTVYYPAIDVEAVRAARPIPRYDVLFIGRLVARKGIFDLLDAVTGLGLKTGIVGDGEDRKSLELEIQKRQLSNQIDVLGALPSDEMYGLLKGCRVFVFPSYEEGYGIVIAEAITAKKPVVTYGLPHYPEAFGEGLMTVPTGDCQALRETLDAVFRGEINVEEKISHYDEVRIFSPETAAKFCLERILSVPVSMD